MTGGVGGIGTQGVLPQQQVGGQDNAQGTQGKSIGQKVASFFKAVGSIIAAPFKALANAISNIGNHAAQGGRGAQTVEQPRLSQEQKTQLLDEVRETPFFKAIQNSTSSMLDETGFMGAARSLLETPEAVKAMQTHGVTLGEAVAISMYTSQAYVEINGQIRSGNETPEVTQLKEAFISGLDKLPSFEGTVYRGSHLPKDVGLQHQEGNVVTATGIYSTTQSSDQAFPNANYSITIAVKEGSGGKDIAMFSDKPTEQEVAFPPGTQFRVTSRVLEGREEFSHMHPPDYGGIPSGVITLRMEEV